MEWQPIETAPKDGTKVILYNGNRAASAQWFDKFEKCENDQFPQTGWFEGISYGYHCFFYSPTHWIPLPEPPNQESNET